MEVIINTVNNSSMLVLCQQNHRSEMLFSIIISAGSRKSFGEGWDSNMWHLDAFCSSDSST